MFKKENLEISSAKSLIAEPHVTLHHCKQQRPFTFLDVSIDWDFC